MPSSLSFPLARRITNALSLLAGSAALIAVLTFSAEARADGPKHGASTAQVLAQESKPMPAHAPARHHATANANAKAKPHAKAQAKAQSKGKTKAKGKAQSKPAKAPAKPAKPTPSARV